jgi:hypothetical protein
MIDPELLRPLFERGYTVVPSYFSAQELEVVREDFESIERREPGVELESTLSFEHENLSSVLARLMALLDAVTGLRSTSRALLPATIGHYISSREVHYEFHCDFGILSPTRDSFKVWIPLIKPDPRRSGMTFVRMDRFREREPEIARLIRDRGGSAIKAGGEVVIIGATTEKRQLSRPIDDLCESPEVALGDVVLFRAQDTFHRSQVRSDDEPERVAWAFPVRIRTEVIHRSDVFENEKKREFLGGAKAATALACSWYHRRSEFTHEELDAFERELGAKRWVPRALVWSASLVEPFLWK